MIPARSGSPQRPRRYAPGMPTERPAAADLQTSIARLDELLSGIERPPPISWTRVLRAVVFVLAVLATGAALARGWSGRDALGLSLADSLRLSREGATYGLRRTALEIARRHIVASVRHVRVTRTLDPGMRAELDEVLRQIRSAADE